MVAWPGVCCVAELGGCRENRPKRSASRTAELRRCTRCCKRLKTTCTAAWQGADHTQLVKAIEKARAVDDLGAGYGGAARQLWVLGAEEDTPEQHAIRLKQANMVGPGGLISMEDGVVGGWVQRATRNDGDDLTILEMGGRDVVPSRESRATEVSIRGFWKGYRELMGV